MIVTRRYTNIYPPHPGANLLFGSRSPSHELWIGARSASKGVVLSSNFRTPLLVNRFRLLHFLRHQAFL